MIQSLLLFFIQNYALKKDINNDRKFNKTLGRVQYSFYLTTYIPIYKKRVGLMVVVLLSLAFSSKKSQCMF